MENENIKPYIDEPLLQEFIRKTINEYNEGDKGLLKDIEYSDSDDKDDSEPPNLNNKRFMKFGRIPKKYIKKLIYTEIEAKKYNEIL